MKLFSKIFLYFMFCACFTKVQEIKLIEATSQSWAGGMPGNRGINYIFKFSTNKKSKQIIPDSLWIGEKGYKLNFTQGQIDHSNFNMQALNENNTTGYLIQIDESIKDQNIPQPDNFNQTQSISKKPKPYYGEAMLCYLQKGKRKYLIIKQIKRLEAINYP